MPKEGQKIAALSKVKDSGALNAPKKSSNEHAVEIQRLRVEAASAHEEALTAKGETATAKQECSMWRTGYKKKLRDELDIRKQSRDQLKAERDRLKETSLVKPGEPKRKISQVESVCTDTADQHSHAQKKFQTGRNNTQEELKDLRRRQSQAEAEHDRTRAELEQTRKALQTERDGLEGAAHKHQIELDVLKEKVSKTEFERDEAIAQISALENELSASKSELLRLQNDPERLRHQAYVQELEENAVDRNSSIGASHVSEDPEPFTGMQICFPPFEILERKGNRHYRDMYDGATFSDHGAALRQLAGSVSESDQCPHILRPVEWSLTAIAPELA